MTSLAPPVQRLLDLAVRIQQIPGLTDGEQARAAFLKTCFDSESLVKSTSIDGAGNVLSCVPGKGGGRPLVLTAHLDSVFPPGTDLGIKRTARLLRGPGIGDNALGAAALPALVWMMSAAGIEPAGDLWLAGTTGEEGLGNLKGMRALVERFGDQPAAYIAVEGMGLGLVFHRGLGARRVRVTVRTKGGHSWVDAGSPSAVHEAARIITRLADLPLPERPRSSLNAGVVSGGTAINAIAAQASFELDLRCEDPQGLQALWQQAVQAIDSVARPGVEVGWESIGDRPAGGIPPDHSLVKAAITSLKRQGIQGKTGCGSTEANLPLSLGYPAICLGITRGQGAHTNTESIEVGPIVRGIQVLFDLVCTYPR